MYVHYVAHQPRYNWLHIQIYTPVYMCSENIHHTHVNILRTLDVHMHRNVSVIQYTNIGGEIMFHPTPNDLGSLMSNTLHTPQ
jgi:hypothetical protein